jgi:uncharacterized protein
MPFGNGLGQGLNRHHSLNSHKTSAVKYFSARQILALIICLLGTLPSAWAQVAPVFPALTGRIVDGASIITPAAKTSIESKIAAHEARTGDQLVVATVPSLQGHAVEDFANRLFRQWKLGEAKTNNGVLLLVAPNERKVRIEVGYGLEGALTDALSRIIISTAITPKFKAGDFSGGIDAGVDGILAILSKDADEWLRRAKVRDDSGDHDQLIPVVIIIIFVVIFLAAARNAGLRGNQGARWHRSGNGSWIMLPGNGGWGGGSSSGGWGGGFSGGGFSGGGGSSGGGGASGDW